MPERLIGAVLKTVVRSRVPWVRIPPPPYKNGLSILRPVFIFCGEDEKTHFRGLRERAEAVALLFAGDEITKTKRVMPLHASEQDRIPPPPPFKQPVKGGFFSGF